MINKNEASAVEIKRSNKKADVNREKSFEKLL